MFDLVSNNYMLQMMDRSMTLSSRRMSLIASNLANIDTPGYQAQDFSFEAAFKQEMAALDRQFQPGSMAASTSGSALASAAGEPAAAQYERNDLNDVSLDQQTMLLAKTQEVYQLSSSFAQEELRRILGAIRDGAK